MTKSKMKRIISVAAVLVSSAIFAVAEPANAGNDQAVPSSATAQSFVGTVSCSWRVTHQYACGKAQTLQSCTLACVQQGSPFVLVVNDKPYLLEGNAHQFEHYAGGKAMVTGTVSGNTITVNTIADTTHKAASSQMQVAAR
jgi:hypothetical protein